MLPVAALLALVILFMLWSDLKAFFTTNVFSLMSVIALQCHYEVHQSASSAAQCTHAQPHCERPELDGLSPGILPWLTGVCHSVQRHA